LQPRPDLLDAFNELRGFRLFFRRALQGRHAGLRGGNPVGDVGIGIAAPEVLPVGQGVPPAGDS